MLDIAVDMTQHTSPTITASGASTPVHSRSSPREARGGGFDSSLPKLLAATPPALRGTLCKRARFSKVWRDQVAELRASVLILRGGGVTRTYDLTEAVRVKADDSKAAVNALVIDFGPSRRELRLAAATETEQYKWLRHLQRARQGVRREDFEPLKVIGEGHFGKVFLARQRDRSPGAAAAGAAGGDLVAVKEVPVPRDAAHVSSALNEREVLGAVPPHPFVVGLKHAFRTPTHLYYALEFHAGADLFEHLRRKPIKAAAGGRFYAAEIVLGLEHLHAHGICYRDLKPENVLVSKDGHVCLADFGLSKRLRHGELTRTICGTRAYLAPEMLRGQGYDAAVDFWQLGCFLFELHAGRSPFWTPRVGKGGGGSLNSVGDPTAALIMAGEVEYTPAMDDATRGAISQLLKTDPAARLTSWGGVRSLPLFEGVDWAAAYRKELEPPVLPLPEGKDHVANFGETFLGMPARWAPEPAQRQGARRGASYVSDAIERELLGFSWSQEERQGGPPALPSSLFAASA